MKRTARVLILLVLSLLTIPLVSHKVSAAVTFQSPQPLWLSSGTSRLPSALHLSNGQLWVSWESISLTGQTSIVYDRYNGTWSGVQTLVSGSSGVVSIDPSLGQMSNGTIILAWSSNQTHHYNAYYQLYNRGAWSSSSRLTNTGSDDYLSKIVVGVNSTLWVFWERDSSSGSCINGLCKQIYYKTLSSGQWSNDIAFTDNTVWSSMPGPVATVDGRILLSWSSASSSATGFNILYGAYNGHWSASSQLTTTPTTDIHPSLAADRNGTLWLFFTREVILSTGTNGVSEPDLFYMYSQNLGSTWVGPVQLTTGGTSSNPVDSTDPSSIQGSDKMLYIFYSSNLVGGGSSYGIFYIRSYPIPTHDVAVTGLQYPPFQYPGGMPFVGEGPVMKINVTVTNFGDYNETISVSATVANTTLYNLGITNGSLPAGSSAVFTFNWNTTGIKAGRYTLIASVSTNDEPILNTYNNNMTARDQVRILPLGDVDQDGSVTITDITIVYYDFNYSVSCNCNHWNPYAAIDGSSTIDIVDVTIASYNFNTVT